MQILVKRRALLSALSGAKAAYPNEFICLFTGRLEKGDIIIEETMIPPGIMVSEEMSSFSDWMMPVLEGVMGTFHSHPNSVPSPSKADRWLFSKKGGVHFIAAEPYAIRNTFAYLGNGKRAEFEVID
ncbi:MAG: Mov34/MPN/PAD-1 family protein [Candidatus Micrarchaeia archaeon]